MSKNMLFILMFLFCSLAACSGEAVPATETSAEEGQGGVLVVGDISDEVAETIKGTQPLADYLATRLSAYGIDQAEVKIAPNLDTMIQMIENGEVDLYFDSPYPILVISKATGAEPILRRLKYGVSEYHSLFFVQADSELESLEDLKGNMVAFEESFSTSGYMLPLSYLVEQGMNPVEREGLDTAVSNNEIGYTFSTADDTTIQWVISGRVPVGVIDNVTFGRLPEETQAELKIIAATENVPRQLVLVRPGLNPDLVTALETELLAMDENEEGQQALEIFLTTEFDTFPEGPEAALSRMDALYELVQDR
ncbi:MAG: phosphate/phosphite/phosphonate ABC transporter substrate-binding protein [Chloroflexi bacterium]|nr:phosphate/phosphite/phosphonate ABC transporter substrate-binding protein [Chloroflexota bacterium]